MKSWLDTPLGQAIMAAPEPEPAQPVATAPRAVSAAFARMYANAEPNRFNQGFPGFNTSEDAELVVSLRNLRARSRLLIRDVPFAKNAKRIVVNNVVGVGVRMQAAVKSVRGGLNERINDAIEREWTRWMRGDSCHTGGVLHFHELERMAVGQAFEAGEIFLRLHRRKFGNSRIPLALEVIEPERIVDNYGLPSAPTTNAQTRLGVEVDEFRRPVAYWIRDLHPGDIRLNVDKSDRAERVPASDIIHLKITDRWPQTRGTPWMHAVAQKLQDMGGYSEAEIIAARGAASYLGIIETPEDANTFGEQQPDGTFQMGLEPGSWMRLTPGEKANFLTPNRPNSQLDPFMRFMLREVAAGTGISYESISRDYSQSNYSSSRLALLDDRDVWRSLQLWFIRIVRERLHEEWMAAAMLARAIPEVDQVQYWTDPHKFNATLFRPRGWTWIDPTKEVAAYKEAIKAGFTTVGAVIAQTASGDDLEDVMTTRRDELDYMGELELPFDTSPVVYVPAESRGQLAVDPSTGEVVPAAAIVPAGAPGGVPLPGQPSPGGSPVAGPTEEANEPPDAADEEEPANAESGAIDTDEDERAHRRVLRLARRYTYG